MPRVIGSTFQTALQQDSIKLALCIKVTCKDGTIYTYTSLDQDFVYSGLTYSSQGSSNASSVKSSIGSGVDNLDIIGLIDAVDITPENVRAGKYDFAKVKVFQVLWDNLAAGEVVLLDGYIGQITLSDGQYVAEVRSKSQILKNSFGCEISATCRVKRLGDAQCKVNIATYTFARTVSSVPSATEIIFAGDSNISDYYSYGVVRMTSGLNAGLEKEIKSHTLVSGTADIILRLPFPYTISPGDTADLEAGCSRRKDADYTNSRVMGTVISGHEYVFLDDVEPSGFYTGGTLTFLSGTNIGQQINITAHTHVSGGADITVSPQPANSVAPGDCALLQGTSASKTVGCAKFNNCPNFHGECRIPGNDVIMQMGRHS